MKLKRVPIDPTVIDPRAADPKGWNLIGMIDHQGGIGNAARENIRALKELTMPHRVISFPSAHYCNPADLPAIHGINYLHFNPRNRLIEELERLPWFTEGQNIGYWAWETTQAPVSWLRYDRYMSQIWVPSQFVKEALEATGFKTPVIVIPHAIEPRPAHKYVKDGRPITFLIQYDGHSRIHRKRPDLSLRAITSAALELNESVRIIVKCHHDDGASLVLEEHAGVKVELISKWLSAVEMEKLWEGVDCFVSLNRGEGFGLPMVEAMARGIAVVATAWGGSCDYLADVNSFPVTAEKLEPAVHSGDAYFKTGYWALPCLEHGVHQVKAAIRIIRGGDVPLWRLQDFAIATAGLFSFDAMRDRMQIAIETHT